MTHDPKHPFTAPYGKIGTHPIIEKMADSFLKWDLPFNFRSDECVTIPYPEYPRSGTNIMDRNMAINMLEHIIKDLGITLSITPDPVTTTFEKMGIKTTPICDSYKKFHDDYLNRMRGISITHEGGPWYNPPMPYGVTPNMSHIEYFLKKEGEELERITPEVATFTRDIFPPAKDPEVVEVLKKAAEIACELDIENTEAIRDAHLSIFDYLSLGGSIIITKDSEHRKLTKTILEIGYDRGEMVKNKVYDTEYYQVYGVEAKQRANRILDIVMDIKEQRRKKLDSIDTRIPDVVVETFLEWDKDWNNDKVDISDVFEGLADSKLRDTTCVAGYCISLDNTDAKWHVIEKPEKLLKLISYIREVTIHGGENYRRYITKITSPNEILEAIYAAKNSNAEDKSEIEELDPKLKNVNIKYAAKKYLEWDKGINITYEDMCRVLTAVGNIGVKICIDDTIVIEGKELKYAHIKADNCSKLIQLLNYLNASIVMRVVRGRQIAEVTYLLENSGMVELIEFLKNKEVELISDTTDYKKVTFRKVNL